MLLEATLHAQIYMRVYATWWWSKLRNLVTIIE